jgi:hypothetical protein
MDYKDTYDLSVKAIAQLTAGQFLTFHFIDIENLCGGSLSSENIQDALSRYVNVLNREGFQDWIGHDVKKKGKYLLNHFVIACDSAHLQKLSQLVDKSWNVTLLPAQGQNGADEALIYWLRMYYESGGHPSEVYIASGDHFFEAAARNASAKGARVRLVFRTEISAANSLRRLNVPKIFLFTRNEIDPLLVIDGEERFALRILINANKSVDFYVGLPPRPPNWVGYDAFTTTKLGKKMRGLEVGEKFYEGKVEYEVIERKILPRS